VMSWPSIGSAATAALLLVEDVVHGAREQGGHDRLQGLGVDRGKRLRHRASIPGGDRGRNAGASRGARI
jgi:hypothetical protein